MEDNFKNLLKQFRIENNLSQNDFVNLFFCSDNYLSKLDTVTLSRWENGKTSPSIEKKIAITKKLNLLVPYIHSIRDIEVSTKINSSLNIRFGIESELKLESYKNLNKLNVEEYLEFIHISHHDNLEPRIKNHLTNEVVEVINIASSLSIGYWVSNDKIESFFIHAFFNDKEYNSKNMNSIIILEQFTLSKSHYKLCALCLFNTLLYNEKLDYVFFYIKNKYTLKLALSLGFDLIDRSNSLPFLQGKHTNSNYIQLLKIETNKLLSNKDFLFFCLQAYIDTQAQHPQLLKEINKIYS